MVFIVGAGGSTVDTLPVRRRFLLDGAEAYGVDMLIDDIAGLAG